MDENRKDKAAPEASAPVGDSDRDMQQELQREAGEGKGLIGDTAKNHNLSGSSTWETLPEPPATGG